MEPVFRSLWSFLTEYACHHPQRRLLGDSGGWLSAADTVRRVWERAEALAALGIGPGCFCAVRAHRDVQTAVAILALQKLGAAAVLVDPRQKTPAAVKVCAELDGEHTTLLDKIVPAAEHADPMAPGFVIFTSGTTGAARAAVLSQYNLVNNLLDSQPLGLYRDDDVALGVLPLDHVFGLVLLAGVCVLGYGLYFPERRDPDTLLTAIARERITRMNGVTALYLSLADRAGDYDVSSLRAGFIGGGAWTPEQFDRIEDRLGMTLVPVYGMSEFVGIACGSWRDPRCVRRQGLGRGYSMNTLKLLLPDGTEAQPGQEGEIHADGPARMLGYLGDESPRMPLLATGDLGVLEDGYLRITGRMKDILIRNGINLSIARIEQALLSVPGVRDAAVVGLPDERAGELPWAMVVCDGELDLTAALSGMLAKNEIPVGFCRRETIPLTHSGKPDRQTIREVLRKWKR